MALGFTLVPFEKTERSSVEAASLVSDYVAFDHRRTVRRQYQKAFGGMAIIVLLGALFGRVAMGEAEVVSALLILPVLALAIAEFFRWRSLVKRLNHVRAEVKTGRKP
jgi:predicted lipid-binding transport protein (Tim44 family)